MAKTTTNAQAGSINKMDAVRKAMAALGNAATRTQIQKFVKDSTGVEMNLDVVSSYKSFVANASKKSATAATTAPEAKPVVQQPAAATKKGQKKKKKRRKAAPQPLAAVTTAPSGKATGIALSDIEMVKELVQKVGANTLKGLIDVFSK